MAFLELKNVSKDFGGAPVLKDINLSVEKGEFVAIVGFSGAGKTTLISLIAGLLKPDRRFADAERFGNHRAGTGSRHRFPKLLAAAVVDRV